MSTNSLRDQLLQELARLQQRNAEIQDIFDQMVPRKQVPHKTRPEYRYVTKTTVKTTIGTTATKTRFHDLTRGDVAALIMEHAANSARMRFIMLRLAIPAWLQWAFLAGAVSLLGIGGYLLSRPDCRCIGPNYVCRDGTVVEDAASCLEGCTCHGPDLHCEDQPAVADHEGCLVACACDESFDLTCSDGIVVADYAGCREACTCEGPNLVCEIGSVREYEDNERCRALCACDGEDLACEDRTVVADYAGCLEACACEGPDRVCEDGTVFADFAECREACACEGPDLICEDGTVIEDNEGCLALCFCDPGVGALVCEDETIVEDYAACREPCVCEGPDRVCGVSTVIADEECLANCVCDGPDLYCEDGTVEPDYLGCPCFCDGYDFWCGHTLQEADSTRCGYCVLEEACGNGVCDTGCENSDLCGDDCSCEDNALCEPGEGCGCRDCICDGENEDDLCGVRCPSGECSGGMSCVGRCWDPCLCAGRCGPRPEPEPPGPTCVYETWRCTSDPDCGGGYGVCGADGFCLWLCWTDADCPGAQQCIPEGEYLYCGCP